MFTVFELLILYSVKLMTFLHLSFKNLSCTFCVIFVVFCLCLDCNFVISAVDICKSLFVYIFLLGSVFSFGNLTFNHPLWLFVLLRTRWSISIEAKTSFSFSRLYKAMFTRDRFQMVPIQKSCRIGLLFTRDLLTVPSIRSRSGPKTGPPKQQVQFLEPFRSQTDPPPCKHLDRFLLADPSPCKHLDRFLLVLWRHFESNNVYSAHA